MTVAAPVMTATDALNIIAQATAEFKGTRKDHEILGQALQTLSEALPKAAPSEQEG